METTIETTHFTSSNCKPTTAVVADASARKCTAPYFWDNNMSVPIPQFPMSFWSTVSISSCPGSASIYSTDGIMFPIIVLPDSPVGSSPPACSGEPPPVKASAWLEMPPGAHSLG